jgi:hypothetical protein
MYMSVVVIKSPPLQWTPPYQFSQKLSIKVRNVGPSTHFVEYDSQRINIAAPGGGLTFGLLW